MKHKIITISRQFGSGGRTIGKKLAEQLSIPCYDAELVEKLAQQSGFQAEYVAEHGEYRPHSSWLANAFSSGTTGNFPTNQDYLWEIQRRIILELAEKSACIIVGRCADYILRDHADCLTVFIHASMAYRADRIVRVYGEREEAPEKRLKNKDKRRSAYYRYYTDMEWGDCLNYHLALDSGVLGIDRCASLIASVYEGEVSPKER